MKEREVRDAALEEVVDFLDLLLEVEGLSFNDMPVVPFGRPRALGVVLSVVEPMDLRILEVLGLEVDGRGALNGFGGILKDIMEYGIGCVSVIW